MENTALGQKEQQKAASTEFEYINSKDVYGNEVQH